jgi:hypothetical protein
MARCIGAISQAATQRAGPAALWVAGNDILIFEREEYDPS